MHGRGYREKKSLHAAEGDTIELRRQRTSFRRLISGFHPASLLFVDESGIHLAMTRSHARAPVGQRARCAAPQNWGASQTVVSALGCRGIVAPFSFKGAMNSQCFEHYIEKVLCPELGKDDVVIMDNLKAHKHPRIRQLIEAAGAWLVYLPPYSPHLSPIELAWSKGKNALRAAAARTDQALIDALGEALQSISESDAQGWFRHCGYPSACG